MTTPLERLLHDWTRPLRLLVRHTRYSPLALGTERERRIELELVTLFREVNAMLSRCGVEYWITYGTLLGWHRNRGLLARDYDIDFGLPIAAYPATWEARHLLPPGFVMHDTSHRHHGPKLYVRHHGWEADLYFYRECNGQLQSCEKSGNQGDVAPFPSDFVHPRQETEFLGAATWRPHNPEAWLRHTYGYIGADAVQDPRTGYWHQRRAQ